MALKLYADVNSNIIIFSGLRNGFDLFNNVADPYVNDASGTVQLLDSNEIDLGFTTPAFTYISGSDGDYYVQVPDDWTLSPGVSYKGRVRLTAGDGLELDGIYDIDVERRTT